MKKNILFLSSNMGVGGFQKSLVSLLYYFDYDEYNVDLLLFSPSGIFMDLIPKQVNILPPIMPSCYFEPFPSCIKKLISKGNFLLATQRIFQAIISKYDKGYGGMIMSEAIPAIKQEYDTIVDYNGQYILYYMVDKLTAKKKITYFHSDYKKWPYYHNADKIYFKKVDYIVTVSDQCKQSLDELFADCLDKTRVIENIISHKTVSSYSDGSNGFKDIKFTGIRIVMIGRACPDKGIIFAIEACKKLKQGGYHIKWYSVGPCLDIEYYNQLIKENNVEDCFIFLGETSNPYAYMRNADIIAHPSKFEGKAVVVEEAKLLAKPIVATNFSTVYDQITNEKNGLIVDMNSEALYLGIKRLIDNPDLQMKFSDNLKSEATGNEREIEKLYKLIEG